MREQCALSADGSILNVSWRKSTFSAYNGDCVEVDDSGPGPVRVRDSKAGVQGAVLRFSRVEWTEFLTSLKD
jgi:hypothetical protein